MTITRPKAIPISLDQFKYGMEIPNAMVAECTNIPEDDENFSFAQIRFKTKLEFLLEKEIGMQCTICVKDGVLRILTHQEASEYHRERFNLCILKMMHSFYKNNQVNKKELDKNEATTHTRTLEIQSKILQSIIKEHPDIKLQAHVRKTPLPIPLIPKQ